MGTIVLVPLHGYGSGSRRQLHNLSNTAAALDPRHDFAVPPVYVPKWMRSCRSAASHPLRLSTTAALRNRHRMAEICATTSIAGRQSRLSNSGATEYPCPLARRRGRGRSRARLTISMAISGANDRVVRASRSGIRLSFCFLRYAHRVTPRARSMTRRCRSEMIF